MLPLSPNLGGSKPPLLPLGLPNVRAPPGSSSVSDEADMRFGAFFFCSTAGAFFPVTGGVGVAVASPRFLVSFLGWRLDEEGEAKVVISVADMEPEIEPEMDPESERRVSLLDVGIAGTAGDEMLPNELGFAGATDGGGPSRTGISTGSGAAPFMVDDGRGLVTGGDGSLFLGTIAGGDGPLLLGTITGGDGPVDAAGLPTICGDCGLRVTEGEDGNMGELKRSGGGVVPT